MKILLFLFVVALLASCKSNDSEARLYRVDVPHDSLNVSGITITGHACIYGNDCLCLTKKAISQTYHDRYLITVYDSVTYIYNYKNNTLKKQYNWWQQLSKN